MKIITITKITIITIISIITITTITITTIPTVSILGNQINNTDKEILLFMEEYSIEPNGGHQKVLPQTETKLSKKLLEIKMEIGLLITVQ